MSDGTAALRRALAGARRSAGGSPRRPDADPGTAAGAATGARPRGGDRPVTVVDLRDARVAVAGVPAGVFPLARERLRAVARAAAGRPDALALATPADLFLVEPGDPSPGYYLALGEDDALADGAAEALHSAARAVAAGDDPGQPARVRARGLLRAGHAALWPALADLGRAAYDRDPTFAAALDAWTADREVDPGQGAVAPAAKRHALLRAGRALYGVESAWSPDGGPAVHEAFPADDRTRATLDGLADAAGRTVRDDHVDLLGPVCERITPDGSRRTVGQFYTHPDVAAAVCRWAVRPRADGRPPRVLDPATGSGSFAVAALRRLAACADAPDAALLDAVAAVDVEPFPLRLAALNLAARLPGVDAAPNVVRASFFDVEPGDDRLPADRFDAVVGNPPYVRQEGLDEKGHYRSHLRAYGGAYLDGDRAIPARADAYVYFVTHALRFLRDGGRLGMVLPSKWLDTRYGEAFRAFLGDHGRVAAVAGFDARAFDALVDAVLLFVEKGPPADGDAAADLVRVEERVAPARLAAVAADRRTVPDGRSFAVEDGPVGRIVSVPQAGLAAGRKLGYYLDAPAPLVELVESPALVRLDEHAEVSFGNKTGANEFFFLDDGAAERWAIPERFRHPAVKSIRDLDGPTLDSTDRSLLDLHDYVAEVRRRDGDGSDSGDGGSGGDGPGGDGPGGDGPGGGGPGGGAGSSDLAARVKAALAADGYDGVVEYVEHGEDRGYHERATLAAREPWFDLGALSVPDVLHPVFYDDRVFVVENAAGAAPSNAIQCVDCTAHADVLPAVLNSTLHRAMLECWGRREGGGALQLLTYELASVPTLDPAALAADEREAIRAAGERLAAGEDGAQEALDEAVLAPLDADIDAGALRRAYRGMKARRIDGAATEAVLVGAPGGDG